MPDQLSSRGTRAQSERKFSAERSVKAVEIAERDVSNADILKVIMSMTEGLREVVAETLESRLRDFASAPVAQPPVSVEDDPGSMRSMQLELMDIITHINTTKREIANLKPADGDNDQIMMATNELDAVVESTEKATSEILEHAEKIQTIVEHIRDQRAAGSENDLDKSVDELEEIGMNILMACGFQDLTGQRINKVVNTLRYIEQRVNALMEIWGISEGTAEAHLIVNAPDDQRPDKDLLNGPQLSGGGVSQDDIDALFG